MFFQKYFQLKIFHIILLLVWKIIKIEFKLKKRISYVYKCTYAVCFQVKYFTCKTFQ